MSDADRCIKCGSCMRACPVVRNFGERTFPGPRSLAVDSPRSDHQMSGDELLKCSMCMSCRDACPSRIDLPGVILGLRVAYRDGVRPGHARMKENIDATGSSVRPSGFAPSISLKDDSDTCLFPGCISRWRLPEIFDSSAAILRRTGKEVSCPDGLVCCGSPLEKIADEVRRERLIAANSAILERFERVITTCPGCARQLSGRYGLDSLHVVEHLYEVVGTERLTKGLDGKGLRVALHVPCHLNREVGPHTVEYLRSILGSIRGLDVIEHRGSSDCCGAGGSLMSGFPELANEMARRKVEAAKGTGAEVLVTACPFCVLNLRVSGNLEVLDITTLLNRLASR